MAAKDAEATDAYFLEKVEFDDESDDGFEYDEVAVDSGEDEMDEMGADLDEDLESALESIKRKIKPGHGTEDPGDRKALPIVAKRAEVLDDFIRNFLIKMKLEKTLKTFQAEWYELTQKGILSEEDVGVVPDIYLRNQQMDDNVKYLREELEKARKIAEHAESMFDNLRKERDFHRMHHKRVVQEKTKMIKDLRRLREHYKHFEPALEETKDKYDRLLREKSMLKLDRDKLATKLSGLEVTIAEMQQKPGMNMGATQKKKKKMTIGPVDTPLPPDNRPNPMLGVDMPASEADKWQPTKTFEGHTASVTSVKIHPKKEIVATTSDDRTWMLWALPGGDLILKGEGHTDWLSSCDLHPHGTQICTGSGDSTVKLWDFATTQCAATFSDHTQAVWDVAFHDSGDYIVSGSMDHTAKLWDLGSMRCRCTLRGHVDSVNSVGFQPFSNNICTASGDKTVSIWDARAGLCIQTFYGHTNACNSVQFSPRGDAVVSSDADGVVKVWDVRMVQERTSIAASQNSVNQATFDPSGKVIAIASEDGAIKLHCAETAKKIGELKGHSDAVLDAVFDKDGQYLMSSSSDGTFRMWQ